MTLNSSSDNSRKEKKTHYTSNGISKQTAYVQNGQNLSYQIGLTSNEDEEAKHKRAFIVVKTNLGWEDLTTTVRQDIREPGRTSKLLSKLQKMAQPCKLCGTDIQRSWLSIQEGCANLFYETQYKPEDLCQKCISFTESPEQENRLPPDLSCQEHFGSTDQTTVQLIGTDTRKKRISSLMSSMVGCSTHTYSESWTEILSGLQLEEELYKAESGESSSRPTLTRQNGIISQHQNCNAESKEYGSSLDFKWGTQSDR